MRNVALTTLRSNLFKRTLSLDDIWSVRTDHDGEIECHFFPRLHTVLDQKLGTSASWYVALRHNYEMYPHVLQVACNPKDKDFKM